MRQHACTRGHGLSGCWRGAETGAYLRFFTSGLFVTGSGKGNWVVTVAAFAAFGFELATAAAGFAADILIDMDVLTVQYRVV